MLEDVVCRFWILICCFGLLSRSSGVVGWECFIWIVERVIKGNSFTRCVNKAFVNSS